MKKNYLFWGGRDLEVLLFALAEARVFEEKNKVETEVESFFQIIKKLYTELPINLCLSIKVIKMLTF